MTRCNQQFSRASRKMTKLLMEVDSDIAITIGSHFTHLQTLMCAAVCKDWSRTFSSPQMWERLCRRNFAAAYDLISNRQDPTSAVCWRSQFISLSHLLKFDMPAKPRIDANLLDAVLEIGFDRESTDELKDRALLRINGFNLVEETSIVMPRKNTCLLRGETAIAPALLERLTANGETCSLRLYLLDRSNGKVALLHDDHRRANQPIDLRPRKKKSLLGVELSAGKVRRDPRAMAATRPPLPRPTRCRRTDAVTQGDGRVGVGVRLPPVETDAGQADRQRVEN